MLPWQMNKIFVISNHLTAYLALLLDEAVRAYDEIIPYFIVVYK